MPVKPIFDWFRAANNVLHGRPARDSSDPTSPSPLKPRTPIEAEAELDLRLKAARQLTGPALEAEVTDIQVWLRTLSNQNDQSPAYVSGGYPFIHSMHKNNMEEAVGIVEKMIAFTKEHADFALGTTCELLAQTFTDPQVMALCLHATKGTQAWNDIFGKTVTANFISDINPESRHSVYYSMLPALTEVLVQASMGRPDAIRALVNDVLIRTKRDLYRYAHVMNVAPEHRERMGGEKAEEIVGVLSPVAKACDDISDYRQDVFVFFQHAAKLVPFIYESHNDAATSLAADLLIASSGDEATNAMVFRSMKLGMDSETTTAFARGLVSAMARKIDMLDGAAMTLPEGETLVVGPTLVIQSTPPFAEGFALGIVSPKGDNVNLLYVKADGQPLVPSLTWHAPFMRTVVDTAAGDKSRLPTMAAYLKAKRPATVAKPAAHAATAENI